MSETSDKTRAMIMAVDARDDVVMVINKHLGYDHRGYDLCSTDNLKSLITSIEGERDRYKRALEKYADERRCAKDVSACTYRTHYSTIGNGWSIAQAALAEALAEIQDN